MLSASLGGLAEAVRRLGWARNQPFPEVAVTLTVAPPGAEVRVVDAAGGQLVSAGNPDASRRVLLPLPEAASGRTLAVVAFARGREASARVPISGPPYAPLELTIPKGSMLSVHAHSAAFGEAIPVRVRVLPRNGTADPNLGPDWAASGAIDTVIAPSGNARIPLPTGFYRVIVTHGPEWSVHDEDVELDVGEVTHVDAQLDHVVDPGPWVACDFHVHAEPSSDSEVELTDRVAALVAEGIAFAVPTDHNHVTDYGDAMRAQPLQGLLSVPGVEVTTAEPNIGHFNAFPFPLDPDKPNNGAPAYQGLEPAALFAALHAVSPDSSCRSITRGSKATSATSTSPRTIPRAEKATSTTATRTTRSRCGTVSTLRAARTSSACSPSGWPRSRAAATWLRPAAATRTRYAPKRQGIRARTCA